MKPEATTLAYMGVVATCALLVSSPHAVAGPATDSEPTRWIGIQTRHFRLIGSVSDDDLRHVADRLERFRQALALLFPGLDLQSAPSATMIVFPSQATYEPYTPTFNGVATKVAGHFVGGPTANYILMTAEGDTLAVAYHEYVHLVIHRVLAGAPAWFHEGLAEYYSTFEMTSDTRARLGTVLRPHVLLLREQGMLPLTTLMAVNQDSALYNEDRRSSFYAQSWLLVHYLLLGQQGKYVSRVAAFVGQLADGVPVEKACEQALGTTPTALEEELWAYAQQESYLRQLVTLPSAVAPLERVSPSVVSEAEVRATLGDVLLNMSRLDQARLELAAALAADGQSAAAHAALGQLLMRLGRIAEARAHLEQAVASPAASWLTYSAYATALISALPNQPVEQATRDRLVIERVLRRAIELSPESAAPYAQLAGVLSQDRARLEQARELIRRALALAPGEEHYLLTDAVIRINSRDYATVRGRLIRLTRARDSDIRTQATDLVAEVDRRLKETDGRTAEDVGLRLRDGIAPPEHFPLFRPRQSGQQRAAGWLTSIECTGGGAWFLGRTGNRQVRLHATRLADVALVTYGDARLTARCGQTFSDTVAVFTYTADAARGDLVSGTAVAIELPPSIYVPAHVTLP